MIEIMAALVVFVIILILLAQMTRDTTVLVQHGNKGMDGDGQARQVLGFLARDLSGMSHRLDMDYSRFKHSGFTMPARYGGTTVVANAMPGNDSVAFVSAHSGTSAPGESAMALVAWKVAPHPDFSGPVLQRLRLPLVWEPDASGHGSPIYLPNTILDRVPDVLTRTQDYGVIGEHIFRIEYQYWLRADSTHPAEMSVTPYQPDMTAGDAPLRRTGSLVVTIAVLDADSRKICGSLEALIQSLPDAVDGKDTAEVWNAVVESPGFASTAQIPPAAASEVRIYQRFLNLPPLE